MRLVKTGAVTIEGNLLFDPELRYTPTGKAITSIQIMPLYNQIAITAELWDDENLAEHGRRFMPITIRGEWRERKWQDRDDNERHLNYITINEWSFGNGQEA
jgi:single-stranded DNA-binding protein